MVALQTRQPTAGPRAWTVDNSAAFDLAAAAANATTEESFAMTGASPDRGDLALWARRAASPAGVFFSHTRVTTQGNFVVATANSTAAPVNPGAESVDLGPLTGGTHKVSPAGQFFIAAAGSGAIPGGDIAANVSAIRAITGATFGATGVGDILVVSPRAALTPGLALDQGIISAGGGGFASIHNLTAGNVDPGAAVFDWVRLRRLTPIGAARPRMARSGTPYIRRFRATIDHGAIAAAAVLEASALVAPIVPILAPDTAQNRLPVVHAVPTAALPAGFAISHARVTADNTLSVGLANVSGAGPTDPVAVTYDLWVFTLPTR